MVVSRLKYNIMYPLMKILQYIVFISKNREISHILRNSFLGKNSGKKIQRCLNDVIDYSFISDN